MEEECDAHKETASDGRHLEKAALISQKPAVNYKSPTGSVRSPQARRHFYNGPKKLVKNKQSSIAYSCWTHVLLGLEYGFIF